MKHTLAPEPPNATCTINTTRMEMIGCTVYIVGSVFYLVGSLVNVRRVCRSHEFTIEREKNFQESQEKNVEKIQSSLDRTFWDFMEKKYPEERKDQYEKEDGEMPWLWGAEHGWLPRLWRTRVSAREP